MLFTITATPRSLSPLSKGRGRPPVGQVASIDKTERERRKLNKTTTGCCEPCQRKFWKCFCRGHSGQLHHSEWDCKQKEIQEVAAGRTLTDKPALHNWITLCILSWMKTINGLPLQAPTVNSLEFVYIKSLRTVCNPPPVGPDKDGRDRPASPQFFVAVQLLQLPTRWW